jgi:hypothetical protein
MCRLGAGDGRLGGRQQPRAGGLRAMAACPREQSLLLDLPLLLRSRSDRLEGVALADFGIRSAAGCQLISPTRRRGLPDRSARQLERGCCSPCTAENLPHGRRRPRPLRRYRPDRDSHGRVQLSSTAHSGPPDETAALWDYSRRWGRPRWTYIFGLSWAAGDHISAERYSDRYDGALGPAAQSGSSGLGAPSSSPPALTQRV